jgi:EAL domain-containing protein (putative c-di-GMP-specific phosphodiesterase class I)
MNQNNVIQMRAMPKKPDSAGIGRARVSAEILPWRNASVEAAQPTMLTVDEVRAAIDGQRVVMHYQPQYHMVSGKTVAAEALVRLLDDENNLIYPDRFIERVEQDDLIVPLGRAVIEQVCADLAACRADGIVLRRVAINLSAHQLNIDSSLVEFTDQILARYGLEYTDLEFELTERQNLTSNCDGIASIKAFVDRGARIVIDDFGIGYSSVVYLTELPISAFKLDRALVSRLLDDSGMQSVVKSLLALADNLGLEVVAEGIETAAQNDYLMNAGCVFAQGFGYAKPMGIDALRSFLSENHGKQQLRLFED